MFSRIGLKSVDSEKADVLFALLESMNNLLSNPVDYEDFEGL